MKILILGGYGAFGRRLAELISDLDNAEIIIAGRSLEKARKACQLLPSSAAYTPLELDRVNIAVALTTHKPDIVIDASGPFQAYGKNPYLVVQACLMAGVHYADLADDADFVRGISQFNGQALERNLVILSGLSTCPALSGAVFRALSKDITPESVFTGIAPSPHAGMGLSVIRAVMSYAGADIILKRGGRTTTAKALSESRPYKIVPPDYPALKKRRFSLVDAPDLQILPELYPDIQDIWVGAGTLPAPLLRLLNFMAHMRAALRLPNLAPLAPMAHFFMTKLAYGEHRGGMFMEVKGHKEQRAVSRAWHLIAEGDHGPYIPAMATAIILQKWGQGLQPDTGARSAAAELELSDFTPLFAERKIISGFSPDFSP